MRKIIMALTAATLVVVTAPQFSSAASVSDLTGMHAQTGLMQRAHYYGDYDDYYPRYRYHRYSYYPRYRYYRYYDYDYYPRRYYYRHHYYHPYRHYYRRYWY